jgi:hypothetical protein
MTLAENEKIDRALKANPVLRARLLTELDRISKLSEPAARRKAIAAFQAANGAAYRGILAQAGVNLSSLAQRLGAISPALKLEVKDGTHLVSAQSTGGSSSAPAPAPSTPPSRVIELRQQDFSFESDRDCGAVAGSTASFTRPMKLVTEGWSAVAGGCMNFANAVYRFELASDEVAEVEILADLKFEALATGLGIMSQSTGTAILSVTNIDTFTAKCHAVAPIAWVGSCDETRQNFRLVGTISGARHREGVINLATSALVNANISPYTSARAEVDLASARITIRKR